MAVWVRLPPPAPNLKIKPESYLLIWRGQEVNGYGLTVADDVERNLGRNISRVSKMKWLAPALNGPSSANQAQARPT